MYSVSEINTKLKDISMKKIPDMIPVKLLIDEKIIIETLTRMGISNKKEHIIFPSCYLIKLKGQHYIAHFKELFLLRSSDRSYDNISKDDTLRKHAVIFNLCHWKMISITDETIIKERDPYIFVLPYAEKKNWKIDHKFNLNTLNEYQAETYAGK